MAKISGTTFVLGYSIILLILFVTFSVLMSKVNPDRVFFDDDEPPDPKVNDTGKEEVVPINPTVADGLIQDPHRRSDDNDTFAEYVRDKNTDNVSPKENLAKERRSLRDPSSVLDQLGIVVLEVTDEEGLPRIEIMFHPKRSLIKRIRKKKRGDINIKKSFRAYDKAKARKGLVTELTDNSVIKIMPDNTIILENRNILESEENDTHNLSANAPNTNVEIGLFHNDTKNAINTTEDSVTVAINDNCQSEVTNLQDNVTFKVIDEKQFIDIETIETTTDETFERTTYIDKMFESEDIVSSILDYLPSTTNLDAFEGNGSTITTYSFTLETTDIYEKYNNSDLSDKDYFDVNNTLTTELTTESDINSFTQIINEQIPKENYSTETKDDIIIEVINLKNAPVEVTNYDASATAVIPRVDNINISDTFDSNEISKGTTYRVNEIFETTEESIALETKDLLSAKPFDTNDKINAVYVTDKVRNIINNTDANIFGAIVERVETLLKAETSDVTDLSLQDTETPIINRASESTIDMNNLLKVLPVINNATNTTDDSNVTAKSVSNSFEGYLAATETIFNDE